MRVKVSKVEEPMMRLCGSREVVVSVRSNKVGGSNFVMQRDISKANSLHVEEILSVNVRSLRTFSSAYLEELLERMRRGIQRRQSQAPRGIVHEALHSFIIQEQASTRPDRTTPAPRRDIKGKLPSR